MDDEALTQGGAHDRMRSLLLVGGGGHCHSCIDVIESEKRFLIKGIVERDCVKHQTVLGYPILGSDANLRELIETTPTALVAVGQIKTPLKRQALFERLVNLGAELPAIVSPLSYVSAHAAIGEGTIVMHGVVINALATIGKNCIINTQALIEHDAKIGNHCHISTGVRVNGSARIGSGAFIGSGAVIRDGIRVGSKCVVAAGAVVMRDVPDGMAILDNPLR